MIVNIIQLFFSYFIHFGSWFILRIQLVCGLVPFDETR